ncbi:MAG TPA: hypothetical protein VMA54_00205 [Steroidobacteraceae bacterium]|nr:hypothetical protein [Steroidobacteraceae bacterium]
MRYHDDQPIHVGDVVTIDVMHNGTVVACIKDGVYLQPHTSEHWTHLRDGILVDTSFAGLVHYPDEAALEAHHVELLRKRHAEAILTPTV